MNGDGIPDVLAASGDGLAVLLGGPSLTFSTPLHYARGAGGVSGIFSSYESRIFDVNDDGIPDIVDAGPNGIYISYGKHNGAYGSAFAPEVAELIGYPTVADFNGDSIPDIAATGDTAIKLSIGKGDGTFAPAVALSNNNGAINFSTPLSATNAYIVHGDFNGDGKLDLLATGSPSIYQYNVYLLLGNGDGTFRDPIPVPNTGTQVSPFTSMADQNVADVNHDGRSDVFGSGGAQASGTGQIVVGLSNGDGTFQMVSTIVPIDLAASYSNISRPALADFSGDGKLDAVYGSVGNAYFVKGHGDGSFDSAATSLPIPAVAGQTSQYVIGVAAGDIDGDGSQDFVLLAQYDALYSNIVAPGDTAAWVYYGDGKGGFSGPVLAGDFDHNYTNIAVQDLNQDGRADIVLWLSALPPVSYSVGVVDSEPGRTFGPEINYTAGTGVSSLAITDINNDGWPDLVFGNGDYNIRASSVTELINLGNPAIVTGSVYATPEPSIVTGPFRLTADLMPPSSALLSGSVSFQIDGIAVGVAALSTNEATLQVPGNLAVGRHTLSASWPGDSTYQSVVLYGTHQVAAPPTPAAAPTFSVSSGTYSSPQSVIISDSTPGATIYYTTNGTTPTTNSAAYSTPILVSSSETIKAIAAAAGYSMSPVGSAAYIINAPSPASGDWTWMAGSSNTRQPPGAYGQVGVAAAGNTPGGRNSTISWTDNQENFWLYGSLTQGFDAAGILGFLDDVWEYNTSLREWAWMAGSKNVAPGGAGSCLYCTPQPVFGTYQTPGAGNTPGSLQFPEKWTDKGGNLWLFGGFEYKSTGGSFPLNTLWEFNVTTHEWAWMGGSNALNGSVSGVYGTLGQPAPGNTPGGRTYGLNWIDSNGNLWLFGGNGLDSAGNTGYLNDLWMFNPSVLQWTWMGGSSVLPTPALASPGVYGTYQKPAAGNIPYGRSQAYMWTDLSGNVWIFGGETNVTYGSAPSLGIEGIFLNDLWEFNSSTHEWAWMGGSSNITGNAPVYGNYPGVYGTLGTPSASSSPGARAPLGTGINPYTPYAWTDNSGNLWLFGGIGSDSTDRVAGLNDVWKFTPSILQWTWMGGSSTFTAACTVNGSSNCENPGVYGTRGVPSASNIPGTRGGATQWVDQSGNYWLYGGQGIDSAGTVGMLNDLWEFSPSANVWTWMGGSTTVPNIGNVQVGQLGIYGALGVPAPGNWPGGRVPAASWSGRDGSRWILGGYGCNANNCELSLNDLWGYTSSAPGFFLSANPSSVSMAAGGSGTSTISVTSQGGFNSSVALSASGQPSGVSVTFIPSSITGSGTSIMTISASAGAAAGNSTVFITGVSGSLSSTTSVLLTITGPPAAATPTFTPPGGPYTTPQSVTISDSTPGATIYYTTNGTAPTTSSAVYSNPISVSSTETIEAFATATGYAASSIATATYTFPVPTTTTLIASSTSLTYGQSLTLTATVTPVSGATPAGTVTFLNGASPLGSAALNNSGVATLTLTPAVGSYSIIASYGGSIYDIASVSAPVAVNVTAAPTSATLTASPNPASFGTVVTLAATVASSTATPTGSVSFYDSSVLLSTTTLASGAGSYSTAALSVGSHTISAVYSAGPGFISSTSNTVIEVITPSDFSIAAFPASQTLYTGQAATYSISVTPGTGFTLPVSFSCAALPAHTTCAFTPATVTGGSGRSTLTIQTTAPSEIAATSAPSWKTGIPLLAGFLFLFIPGCLRKFHMRLRIAGALLMSVLLGAAITACSAPGPLVEGTPVGGHTITVTGVAASGSQTLTHTTSVTLNVKSLF